ncbi:hypothetical protein PLIIFM63780_002108 [Purpureocillium lilacinum]|nr:hypothetical protein PLIIFM63780_002108 [Purpureocillium lilacinum]
MYPLVAFALLVLVGLGHSSILTRIPAGTGPASSIDKTNNGGTNSKNDANRGGANRSGGQNCLREDLIQSASGLTGQETGTQGIKPGQAKSGTDENNFINFCKGQELTNGEQITSGSCNGVPMGRIPATSNMISAIITHPQPGDIMTSDTTFNVSVQTAHLVAGNFVNPTTNYYSVPQDLDNNGDVIDHFHVTIQDIRSMKSTTPPNPTKFALFKGIDDAGNGQGLLQAVVQGGLPPGAYRACTMIAAENHQPVAMPVAQRGAQDDCTKFEVATKAGGGPFNSGKRKDGDMTKNQDQEGFVKGAGGKPSKGNSP